MKPSKGLPTKTPKRLVRPTLRGCYPSGGVPDGGCYPNGGVKDRGCYPEPGRKPKAGRPKIFP